ncbi:MAG: hypothetical protein IPK82_13815 [Polyangiaceae bacterium]|nr:hypothetical protein [Polyangiaceae bacterium]
MWPLFGLAGAFLYLTRLDEPSSTQRTIAVIQAAFPAALLWIPLVRVLLIMVGPTMPPAAVIPLALLGGLITPALVVSERKVKWALPAAGAAVGLLAAVIAII